MNTFQTAGEALLAGQEGQRLIAEAMLGGLRRLGRSILAWFGKAPAKDAYTG